MVEAGCAAENVPQGIKIVPKGLARDPKRIFACAVRGDEVHEVQRRVENCQVSFVGRLIGGYLDLAEDVLVPLLHGSIHSIVQDPGSDLGILVRTRLVR